MMGKTSLFAASLLLCCWSVCTQQGNWVPGNSMSFSLKDSITTVAVEAKLNVSENVNYAMKNDLAQLFLEAMLAVTLVCMYSSSRDWGKAVPAVALSFLSLPPLSRAGCRPILHWGYFISKYPNVIGAEAALGEGNRLLRLGCPSINEYS